MSVDEELGVDVPDKLFFRIGEVAEIVGVEPHVLRYWEGEFRMRPGRSASGQRMYRRKDIGRFVRIRRLLHEEGFTIAGARKALSDANSGGDDAPIDVQRVREALGRMEDLRLSIRALRDRLAQPLGAEPGEPD